ncbi:MAG: helix-turn-helix transcriptional regulator [Cytophagales bacterium]|nr:helix-turn-helix transcriptional regulator [Cytophagales bacterium]
MEFRGANNEFIQFIDINEENQHLLNESQPSELSLLWFKSDNNRILIDNVEYTLNKNHIISLTEFHNIESIETHEVQLIKWNRDFYCIVDHDSEVSCKGILYYGASKVPIIQPNDEDLDILVTVLKMFQLELESRDNLQLEMLQMMLKRLLILCTRIYKRQNLNTDSNSNIDIIREYNYLVEQHFKEKHTVNEYADLLHKSPKTLSNLFKKHSEITPLKFIQNRIMLEARRLLTHSSLSVSEIGYELGFSDVQVFSRFFKKQEGCSPQKFKEGKN